MSAGEGKGWAKGRTAATDGRVARNAERHRGMTYERHLTPEQDKRHRFGSSRTLPLEWSETMSYVVGLMATDGCLIERKRQLNFKSEDEQLVQTFLECLGRRPVCRVARTRLGRPVYVVQFGDPPFYEWLQDVGLIPRKSLVLGSLAVPDNLLLHCARGLLDGDGSLLNYWYDGGGKAKGRRYEGFATVFNSASERHLRWLRDALSRSVAVRGSLSAGSPNEHGTVMWRLAYAIRESSVLLPRIYPTVDVPCLHRKRMVWDSYAARHGLRATGVIAEVRSEYKKADRRTNRLAIVEAWTRGSTDRYH